MAYPGEGYKMNRIHCDCVRTKCPCIFCIEVILYMVQAFLPEYQIWFMEGMT